MNHFGRTSAFIVASALLAACKPATETPDQSGAADAKPAATESSAPKLALLNACTIKMNQPEVREWTTYWDPAHTRTVDQNPSGVRSAHWANATEMKAAVDMGNVIPLEILCGSDDRVEPTIKFNLVAYDSSLTDIPLTPGTYPIVAKAGPHKNKPGEFIVAAFFLDKAMFAAKSGTLKLERFDKEGVAGSFVIEGNEILMGSRPLHVEGTFDMPCRRGMLQGACESKKAETTD